MIKENEFEFKTLNILQWHNMGYKGEGIKWASLENDTEHNKMVVDVLKQVAPGSEEYQNYKLRKTASVNGYSPDFEKFIDECIENKVDIITCSYNYEDNPSRRKAIQKAIDAGIIICWSAGNENEEIGPKQVRYYFPEILIWSAVLEVKGGKIERTSYSNKGKLIDNAGFTNIVTTNKSVFTGTSCSTPFNGTALLILLLQYLKENNLPRELYKDFLQYSTIDLGDKGKDRLYGNGLFILPDLDKLNIEGDNMSAANRDLNELLPYVKTLAEQLVSKCKEQGIPIVITETYRSQERQNELYAQGRTTPGTIVTWTKTSYHTSRKAFDFYPVDAKGNILWTRYDLFAKVGAIAKELGLFWGGDWKTPDKPHIQYNSEIKEVVKVEEPVVVKPIEPHWAERYYTYLINNGVDIKEKEFDKPITRGEVFALLARLKGFKE